MGIHFLNTRRNSTAQLTLRGSARVPRLAGLIAGMVLCAAPLTGSSAGVPSVTRVEPPNWWAGHSFNPVRLLISGENLSGARMTAPENFEVGAIRYSEDGGYMFVDLQIPLEATPGEIPLRLSADEGEASVPFTLLAPLPPESAPRGFSTDDVIYLLMTDRFSNGDPSNDNPRGSPGLLNRSKPRHYHGGDIQGAIDRLDYLLELGVTTLWLTPWCDNANQLNHVEKYSDDNKLSPRGTPSTDYHGYGAVDFYAVEEHFGDIPLLREFVSKAQASGLKVVQDQIANHTGPLHVWVTNAPTPTWYNGTLSSHLANSWQIWTTTVSNPPPDELKSTLDGWFLNILPDLNQNDPEVATYLIQNSLWWLGMTGVDVVRQDTLPYVPRSYWAQWTAALRRQYSDLTILGEVLDSDPRVVSFFQGGEARFDSVDSGVETLFDFPLYYAIRDVFAKGRPMTQLTETLAADTNYVDSSVLVTFLGLHDKPRFLHEPGATVEDLKLAFAFVLTTRGTPMIYYGDEIAMNGGGDPQNRRDFPGGWQEDSQNAFESSGRTSKQNDVHAHVSALLSLRRELEPVRRGELVNLSVGTNTYAFARTTSDSFAIVALNNSLQEQVIDLSIAGLAPQSVQAVTDRLGALGSRDTTGGRLSFTLSPKSAALFIPEPVIAQTRKAAAEGSEASETPLIAD